MNSLDHGRQYFPALDGLRGIAILLVLISHNFGRIPFAIDLGGAGVDLFFVLSGFLITDILLRTIHQPHWYRSFFIRRALRIFPIYYLALLVFFILVPESGNDILLENLGYYSANWPFVFFHLNNILGFYHPDYHSYRIWRHLWSLSLEEQFYLCWPPLLWLFCKKNTLYLLVGLLVGGAMLTRILIWVYLGDEQIYWYAISSVRWDCLVVGAFLAAARFFQPLQFKGPVLRFCILLLMAHALGMGYKYIMHPAFPAFAIFRYSSFSALAVLAVQFGIGSRSSSSWLSHPGLRFLGKISYGLYIYHFPLFLISKIYFLPTLRSWFPFDEGTRIAEGLFATALALVASVASYYWLERPILQLKKKWT